MIQRLNLLKVVKIGVGALAAMLAASALGLSYVTSAGIITVLSIQNTKRETIFVIVKRSCAFLFALIIAYGCFTFLGYHLWVVGVFLLLFAAVCNLCSFQDAIAMDTVLITHFYTEQSMSLFWVRNEALLLLIGVAAGMLMNSYIPGNKKEIRKDQRHVEDQMREILGRMSEVLLDQSKEQYDGTCFGPLELRLKESVKRAVANRDNTLLTDTSYFITYMEMRRDQTEVLKKIYENICLLDRIPSQTFVISEFFQEISIGFHEYNNVQGLMEQLDQIQKKMKEEPLPKNREEFENRAVLYRILYELEDFLALKRRFVENLTEKQIRNFWKEENPNLHK